MYGYTGKALFIDLSYGTIESKELPLEWYRDFIGGEGLAVRLFYEYLVPNRKPYDPVSPIIFSTGPLTATRAPASGRLVVAFHSPATGTVGITNVGGHFAPCLKKAGYDLLLIKGKAADPVWLMIDDNNVEIKNASAIWRKEITPTEEYVKNQMGIGTQVITIGPAGENLVRYSCMMTDKHRSAGRGGGGAIMGFKNLKAIGVRGSKSVRISSSNDFKTISKQIRQELKADPTISSLLSPFGTSNLYTLKSSTGILPTKNWQQTTYPESHDKLGHEGYHNTLKVKAYACAQCPIACGRETMIKEGPYAGQNGGGPEYETLAAFGSKCLINDVNAVAKCGYECNELGLDTISAGQIIATAMEWYERGNIDKKTTDGIELTWGNSEAVLLMLRKIAFRDGFGDLLAEGSKRAGEKLGGDAADYTFQVKGLEMAACGVRASKGEAVVHATSPRGADHLRPYASVIDAFGMTSEELNIKERQDPLTDGTQGWVKPLQELSMIPNLLGTCLFASTGLTIKADLWAKILSATVSSRWSAPDLLKAAERVINLERMINYKLGFDRKDDTLPKRLLKEPAPDGVGKGIVVDLNKVLESYYTAMDWDLTTGIPNKKKLDELGLSWML